MSITVTQTSANVFYQSQITVSNDPKFNNCIFDVPNPDEQIPSATTDSHHTKKYEKAQMRLDKAEQELLSKINTTANKIAQTNDPTEKDELRKKLSDLYRIKEVRKSVKYEISEDGAISFEFSNSVNVEDFKKAFGIKDGKLRNYLRDRHDDAVYFDGTVIIENVSNIKEENKNIYHSYYEYSDGCIIDYYNKHGCEGCEIDYSRMELGPNDNDLKIKYDKLEK